MATGPYVGLRPYEAADRHLFHGRETDADTVRALWQSSRLVVLFGQSGVGKTSLLHAGVLPMLGVDEADVLPVGRVSQGTAFPTAAVPNHNPYTFALLSSWSRARTPSELGGISITAFLRRHAQRRNEFDDPIPLYGAIDQFEELFSDLPHRAGYREEFIAQLREATDAVPRLRLLISIREDFLGRLLPYEHRIVTMGPDRYGVQPLRRGQALAAVTGPLRGTNRVFAPGVAERLVDDLRTTTITNSLGETHTLSSDTVEPTHLQMICAALWDGLPEDSRIISFQHLQEHGDIDRTLGNLCAGSITEVAAQHGLPTQELWNWLKAQFITELGTRGMVYEGISTTAGMANSVARELASRHLLKAEERAGSRWFELSHDRLIDPVRAGNRPWSTVEKATSQSRSAVLLRTAESALADGDLTLAERYGGEAIRFGGDRADPRIRAEAESFLAGIAVERNRLDEAEGRFRAAVATFDALGDAAAGGRVLARIGRLLLDRGQAANAVNDLATASSRLPGDVGVRTEHARALWLAGQAHAALAVLNTAISIEQDHAPARALRGTIQAEHGPAQAALMELDYAARLDPAVAARPEVVAARAYALRRLGRADPNSS